VNRPIPAGPREQRCYAGWHEFAARVDRQRRRRLVCDVAATAGLATVVAAVAAYAGVAYVLDRLWWAAGLFVLSVTLFVATVVADREQP
jgi:small-conductance mechanosensitive channel